LTQPLIPSGVIIADFESISSFNKLRPNSNFKLKALSTCFVVVE